MVLARILGGDCRVLSGPPWRPARFVGRQECRRQRQARCHRRQACNRQCGSSRRSTTFPLARWSPGAWTQPLVFGGSDRIHALACTTARRCEPPHALAQPNKRQQSDDDDDCTNDIDDTVHVNSFRERRGVESPAKGNSLHLDIHHTLPGQDAPCVLTHTIQKPSLHIATGRAARALPRLSMAGKAWVHMGTRLRPSAGTVR